MVVTSWLRVRCIHTNLKLGGLRRGLNGLDENNMHVSCGTERRESVVCFYNPTFPETASGGWNVTHSDDDDDTFPRVLLSSWLIVVTAHRI